MRPLIKLLPAVIAVFVVMDGDRPPLAIADGCPGCSSNSPIINPFPIMWLHWGTSKVLKGSSTCKKFDKIRDPRIAIDTITQRIEIPDPKIPPGPPVIKTIRGYQLIVVDDSGNPACTGTELGQLLAPSMGAGKVEIIARAYTNCPQPTDSLPTPEFSVAPPADAGTD